MSSHPLACGDRSGFLFAHACDRPAMGQCHRCGRPICVEHTRMTPSGPTCVACLREDSPDHDRGRDSSTGHDSPRSAAAEPDAVPGGGRYGGAGATEDWPAEAEAARAARADDPYFSPLADPDAYYDADDLRAFDAAAAAAAAGPGDADAGAVETDTGAS